MKKGPASPNKKNLPTADLAQMLNVRTCSLASRSCAVAACHQLFFPVFTTATSIRWLIAADDTAVFFPPTQLPFALPAHR